MEAVVIRYSGEIGSKGANRRQFEKKLKDNLRSTLTSKNYESLKIMNSRIVLLPSKNISKEQIADLLTHTPGISSFSFGKHCENDPKAIEACIRSFEGRYNIKIRIPKKRENIDFESLKNSVKDKLDIHSPALNVEVLNTGTFVTDKHYDGINGLPVGISGKLICLLSGGIDSPLAAYRMLRRGCSITYVHFYNPTQVRESVKQKIFDLVDHLSKFQFKTRLYIVKFDDIQRDIIMKVPSQVRMIIYRRVMFHIADMIRNKEHAKGFVTGDSLAQVASQTLDNVRAIYDAADYPVFHPLIGDDKDSIIKEAKEIGTYEISVRPYGDCCSYFIAKHPETHAELEKIKKEEGKMDHKLWDNAFRTAQEKSFFGIQLN